MSVEQNQNEIDKNQMIAGLEMGRALIDFHKNNPDKIIKQEEVMDQLAELVVPERYKDLSRDDLRKMVFDSYVRKASMSMASNHMEGRFEVSIPTKHFDYIDQLTAHWKEKGYIVSVKDIESLPFKKVILEW